MFWAAREIQWSHKRAPCPKGLGNHSTGFIVGIMDWKSSYEPGISSKCESLACIEYVPELSTHRPSLLPIESFSEISGGELCDALCIAVAIAKVDQTWWFRGSKSRNKVSVGEPAEGSLMYTVCLTLVMGSCCIYVQWTLILIGKEGKVLLTTYASMRIFHMS
jgi:hypothetical protein